MPSLFQAAMRRTRPLGMEPVAGGAKRRPFSLDATGSTCRIGDAPVGLNWRTRPVGAALARRRVANGDDDIELGRAFVSKLIPRFGPQLLNWSAFCLQKLDGLRVGHATRMPAGRLGRDPAVTQTVQYGLAQNGARGVGRTSDQNTLQSPSPQRLKANNPLALRPICVTCLRHRSGHVNYPKGNSAPCRAFGPFIGFRTART